MTKYDKITTVEQAKTLLEEIEENSKKIQADLDQRDKDWQTLSATFEEEVKKQVNERLSKTQPADINDLKARLNALQAENDQYSEDATAAQAMIDRQHLANEALNNKIKELQSQQGESKEEQSTWEKIQTPVIIGGGLILIFLVWKLISSKFSSK